MDWTAFIKRLLADASAKSRHCDYWIITRTAAERKELQEKLRAALETALKPENLQSAAGLLYSQGHWAIFFYTDRELDLAPVVPLDGIMLAYPKSLHRRQLEGQLKRRQGWLI